MLRRSRLNTALGGNGLEPPALEAALRRNRLEASALETALRGNRLEASALETALRGNRLEAALGRNGLESSTLGNHRLKTSALGRYRLESASLKPALYGAGLYASRLENALRRHLPESLRSGILPALHGIPRLHHARLSLRLYTGSPETACLRIHLIIFLRHIRSPLPS